MCVGARCPVNVGAIDAAALGPFKKQANGLHGRANEKSRSSLFWLRFLWLVQFRENH